jgi:heptosyltransferase-1
MKSALIIKTSSIGDILQTFDVLSYLKDRQGIEKVDWIVEKPSASLIEAHPDIHQAIVIDTKAWRNNLLSLHSLREIAAVRKKLQMTAYDVVFDLQGNSKSALFTLWAQSPYKVGYTWDCVPEKTNWLATNTKIPTRLHKNVRDRYLSLVQGFFRDSNDFKAQPFSFFLTSEEKERVDNAIHSSSALHIAICCGSNWPNKCLSEERILSLCTQMAATEPCFFYFVWGNAQEKIRAEQLAAQFSQTASPIGNFSLPELHAFFSFVDGVIAMDSAPLHLAALTETPTLSFFGPSKLDVYKPQGPTHRAVQGKCPYGTSFAYRCPKLRTCPTGACMHAENLSFEGIEMWVKNLNSLKAPL